MNSDIASTNKARASKRAKASQDEAATDTSKRITVNLPPESARMLEILSDLQSVSLNEAIRRAISTESFIQNEIRNNNSKLLLESPTGEIKELVFR